MSISQSSCLKDFFIVFLISSCLGLGHFCFISFSHCPSNNFTSHLPAKQRAFGVRLLVGLAISNPIPIIQEQLLARRTKSQTGILTHFFANTCNHVVGSGLV